MKKAAVLFLTALAGRFAQAQYKPVENASSVKFSVKNFGFAVTGSFTGLTGRIQFDPDKPADAVFEVSIDVNSVNTDNTMRDDHLRKFTYLNAKDYPLIKLVSTKIVASGKKGGFVFSGKLTIKSTTKDVVFPFTAQPSSGGGYLFAGTFSIDRKDFDVGGVSTISDRLDIILSVLAK